MMLATDVIMLIGHYMIAMTMFNVTCNIEVVVRTVSWYIDIGHNVT